MEKADIIRELAISMVILLGGFLVMVGFLFAVFKMAFPFKRAEEDKVAELKSMMKLTRPPTILGVRPGKIGFSHW